MNSSSRLSKIVVQQLVRSFALVACIASASGCEEGNNGPNLPEIDHTPGRPGEACNRYTAFETHGCEDGAWCINGTCHLRCGERTDSSSDCGGGACVTWDFGDFRRINTCKDPRGRATGGGVSQPAPSSPASANGNNTGGGRLSATCQQLLRAADPSNTRTCTKDGNPSLSGEPCVRDTNVAAAVVYCWAAECDLARAGSDWPMYMQKAEEQLSSADELCSNAPVFGTPVTCSTLSIHGCK